MSCGTHPNRVSTEDGPKEYKLWKIYQTLKKKLESERKSPVLEATTVPDSDERDQVDGTPEDRIVEFIWEGDVEISIKIRIFQPVTVHECKDILAEGLEIPIKNINLTQNGIKLKPKDEIGLQPGAKIYIEFYLDDSVSETEEPAAAASESIPAVTVKKVMMKEQDGRKKYKEVAIIRESDPRQFFGGYRNKVTQQVYHHVMVQTQYKGCAERNLNHANPAVKKSNRETQTLLPIIDKGINTLKDKCIQMSGTGVYIPTLTDRIVVARPYLEYDTIHKNMTPAVAVVILQRAWRHYINMKKEHLKYSSIYNEEMARLKFEGSSMAEFYKQRLSELTRDSFPTSRGDFYDLYTAFGEWTKTQKKELEKLGSGFARKVSMVELNKKQTRGVLAIERLRIRAKEENLQKQDIMFLEGTARSRVRTYPNGSRTFIDDLNIKRARDLKEMYANYTRTDTSDAERIELLTNMKNCFIGFETIDMVSELVEILEREVDLIKMGIGKGNLVYLRKRFESLFVNLCKKPEFNPQAKYYRKSSEAEKKYPIHRCISCHKVLHTSHMYMHLRMSRFRVCTSCSYMHTTATASINLAPYKRILNALRSAETDKGCRSAIPFLLQPTGMYYLVSVLWNGRSIISGSSYLPGLRVTRWLPNEEWSMWNMILLTELEAHKHEKLTNPLEHYSKEFVLNVMNRNILGRIHFHVVADIDLKFGKREQPGVLPKDHLLYTTKKAEGQLRKNNPHPFLVPNTARFGEKRKAEKRDAGT